MAFRAVCCIIRNSTIGVPVMLNIGMIINNVTRTGIKVTGYLPQSDFRKPHIIIGHRVFIIYIRTASQTKRALWITVKPYLPNKIVFVVFCPDTGLYRQRDLLILGIGNTAYHGRYL